MMEINLSCPNIPDKPPPAYDSRSLVEYANFLKRRLAIEEFPNIGVPRYLNPGTNSKILQG